MEHLIFIPDQSFKDEIAYADGAEVLRCDWENVKDGLVDFIPQKTPFLGFDHNVLSAGKVSQYLQYAGFDESKLWNGALRESSLEHEGLSGAEIGRQVASLIQTWLFYGLLESIVGKKIEVSYLMRCDENGDPFLYTRNLHFCLQVTAFRMRMKHDDEKLRMNDDIQLELQYVYRWVTHFNVWGHHKLRIGLDTEYPGFLDSLDEVLPAIVRLAEAIDQTRIYAQLGECPSMGTLSWHHPFRVIESRKQALKTLGWCDFQIELLEQTVNQSTIDWFVATGLGQDAAGHDHCTANECDRNNVDSATYQQHHICDSGECDKLLPHLHQVMDILGRGDIPVMRLNNIGQRIELTVHSRRKNEPGDYIAISHVWSNGLGGATETGLNTCQVKEINRLCRSYRNCKDNVYFWLDSLCIPRSDRDIYIMALVGIRDVYMSASSVLVIDKAVASCSVSDTTELLYARLYMSAWMQRMWTFEEAILAKDLVFVLKDGFHQYSLFTPPSMRQTVCVVFQSLGAQLFRLRAVLRNRLNIGQIHRAFRYRLTNAPQEEFLSASGMLNLDTKRLLQVKGEERTKLFWLLLKSVSYDVLFLDGPKLSTPGFRWAPKTMMYPSPLGIGTSSDVPTSESTPGGLVGTYLLAKLDASRRARTGMILFGIFEHVFMQHDADSSVLRIGTVESWPMAPDSAEFDAIAIDVHDNKVPHLGQWGSGAALCSEIEGDKQVHECRDQFKPRRYHYVGRIIYERLETCEFAQSSPTILFPGADKVLVSCAGTWETIQICVS